MAKRKKTARHMPATPAPPKVKKRGRPPIDPTAPPPPVMSIQQGTVRYRKGWDTIKTGLENKIIPGFELNGRWQIITSLADKLFGLVA
jgi:hypothetical protein